ncbi:hypothetical protein ACJJTC_006122, partial [Scirpophaga incertulas]
MDQVDQNINKDMLEFDLIDVENVDFSDDQTWLFSVPNDTGNKVDIVDWNLSCEWPIKEDNEYQQLEKELNLLLDNILKNEILAMPDKHKFDSRTYVKPKRRPQRPSIQNIVEVASNAASPANSLGNVSANKYLTYNKYTMPLGPISPMLRLKTFNVDTNSENSHAAKDFAMKRRSLVQDEDPQLEDLNVTLVSEASERLSSEHLPTKPINIDLSQPVNLHNTFNKGLVNMINERGSLNMYQSGESLMRMSPPSLVSSLLMESSGTFNPESLDSRKSMPSQRDSGIPFSGRDSIDPMMTSMTLSILDEKDMSTSFLSQTTYPDNDSLIDSLPPSLVSSINSSYIVSKTSKPKTDSTTDSNIFSSTTFTHLEQSEKLLTARPRCQLYNSFKRDSGIKNSESYTKSREEACQIDTSKVLNENCDKKDTPKAVPKVGDMTETITLHYSNTKFKCDNDSEKENMNATFEQDDTFYKDMGMQRTVDLGRNTLNVMQDKQELNEIIQARQKLSLARKALPTEPEKLPNQMDQTHIKTIQLPNQTITVPRQSMENASELLSRRRAMNGGYDRNEDPPRETPKRNATFKKVSPKASAMDTTVVYVKSEDNHNMIDINSETLNLIDSNEKTLQHEDWGLQERAMVGSSESTDTGTFSSSSPPESVPDTVILHEPRASIASTPLTSLRKGALDDLLNLHNTISPIYDTLDEKSYAVAKSQSNTSGSDKTYIYNTTVINNATLVKKTTPRRDILAGKYSPDRKEKNLGVTQMQPAPGRIFPTNTGPQSGMAPPTAMPRKSGLPTSKLRQYSSHRELSRIP